MLVRQTPPSTSVGPTRVPDHIVDLACAQALTVVPVPEVVLELWSDNGGMLPRALRKLGARQGFALHSGLPDRTAVPVENDSGEDVDDVTRGHIEGGLVAADVVMGMLPWRWAARPLMLRTDDVDIELIDDPACAELVRACWLMPSTGVAVVIAGPGFVARRSPHSVAANLPLLGIRLLAARPLDRGAFRPASGRGRIMLVFGRT